MKVQLREPKSVMKLSKLGSFHQTKLSFLRSFLNEFKDWKYKRDLFDLDEYGYGRAVYSFQKKKRERRPSLKTDAQCCKPRRAPGRRGGAMGPEGLATLRVSVDP